MTQGMVVVREDGKVVMKIVAGCEGMRAANVSADIKELWPVTIDVAYNVALANGFGCGDSLVVVTESDIRCDEVLEGLFEAYKVNFEDPNFNPRWECGLVDHLAVLDV